MNIYLDGSIKKASIFSSNHKQSNDDYELSNEQKNEKNLNLNYSRGDS